ncbi:hypothetical protein DACRYDRAFT_64262 [Dacryopinax primogenitus]|uniref:Adenylate cyclase n=1 Tax=Dacryopinax primogenitus (strain DJM 731) TaxID=1858805 RepID=M5G6Z3_DACPD|nr:uncharacterized protein DACRYDRAFT_64262 [Dacryopinax primogenitus]EJU04479.1 hypothetical protein DACRYDRAFT_64262 [Dacryopinax primogenitus]
MSFGAVGDEPPRSSVDTLATGAEAGPTDDMPGRLSITTESSAAQGRPSLVRQQSQAPGTEWEVPDSWAVMTEEALAKEEGLESEAEESDEEEDSGEAGIEPVENDFTWDERDGKNWMEEVEDKYVLRVYRPNGSWHVVSCPLTATAYDIRQSMVTRFGLENEGMIGRYRFFIVEKGRERMLMKKEKPLVILRRRLLTAGYTKLDKLKAQGGRELQHLCSFVLQMSDLHGLTQEYDGMFDHMQGDVKLDELNLQTIPAQLHKVAPHLERLSLRHNPITDLPKDFCMATTHLRELNLSRTALKRLPAAISFCTSLTLLDASYNRITTVNMNYGGLQNLVHLKVLKLHANLLTDLSSSICDLPVEELRLDMNRLTHVPSVVCRLHLLKQLVLADNDIKKLPAGIGALTQLEMLVLARNDLQELPNELRYLASLRTLDIARNQIKDISVISALPALYTLEAAYNDVNIIPERLPKKLKVLNLQANTFTRFNPSPKSSTNRGILRRLDLSHTKLSSLQLDFGVYPDLEELILDDSRIGELPPTVTKLKKLARLSACNASLKHLPDTLGDMERLSILLVHSNDLTAIPETIWMCSHLVVFNASSNKLTGFPTSPSGGEPPLVKVLKELYLANNFCDDSVLLPISMLTHLRILNLSYNPLRGIPDETLSHLTHLEALFLSATELMAVRAEVLPPTGAIRRLYLNGNYLQSLPLQIVKYEHMQVLDVGNNLLNYNINNTGYDYQWIWNQKLKMLNLSGNKLLKIDKPPSNRHRPGINAADFRVLRQLELLGLIDVTLAVTYLPEESARCRIRTTASSLNGMRYDVSDAIDEDLIGSFDMVVPKYRGRADECLFGIFTREQPLTSAKPEENSLTRFVVTHFPAEFERQLDSVQRHPELGEVEDAIRRTFVRLNKTFYANVVNMNSMDIPIKASTRLESGDPVVQHPELQNVACGCVAYLSGRTLYIAHVGNVEALLGRVGERLDLVTRAHVTTDTRERERIKTSEARIAPQGILRGESRVPRAFGFFSKFPVINSSPDIRKIQLSPDHQFIIIGNAEFWSYVKKDVAAKIVRNHHQRYDGMSAAQALRDLALGHGASSRLQVMVVMLSDLFPSHMDMANLRRTGGSTMTLFPRDKAQDGAPTGNVVLVFTDVRNSTALWERLSESMHHSLDIHNKCMRRMIRLCGGYEVKTEGDAFMIAFPSLLGAVRCCLEVQVQLLLEDWPADLLACKDGKDELDENGELIERGISVRMGIHLGIPWWHPDPTTGRMDYFGPVVNRAARVAAAAKGGYIMLSGDATDRLQPLLEDDTITATNGGKAALSQDDQRHLEVIKELLPVLISVGKTDLKGIEQPEWLTLLFPKRLVGRTRLDKSQSPESGVPGSTADADPHGPGMSREGLVSLALVCRRLEALDSGQIFRLLDEAVRDPAKQSNEKGQNVIYGRQEELLSRIGYNGSVQVDQVLETLINRVEHYISRLRLKNAFDRPEVRKVMLDSGFAASELLHLFRDATVSLPGDVMH